MSRFPWVPGPIRRTFKPVAKPVINFTYRTFVALGTQRLAGQFTGFLNSIARLPTAIFMTSLRALKSIAQLFSETKARLRASVERLFIRMGKRALSAAVPIARWLTERRVRQGRVRTLWGVTPILTLPLLARADALLGMKSRSFVYTTYYISNSFDINLSWWFRNVFAKNGHIYIGATYWILAWIILRYDVFHYFYDRGILLPPNMRLMIDPEELKVLKAAEKRIYTYAYGADVRTRETTLDLGKYNFCIDCDDPRKYCICTEEEASSNIEGIRPYANAMVSMIDMVNYVPGCRNMHYWPIDIDSVKFVGVKLEPPRPIKVLHAPNHMHFKGSKYLFEAVDRLKAEGVKIELKTISGVSNDEVLAAMAEADIVAEQFIGGAFGYTALEALSIGKPVITFVRNDNALQSVDDFPGFNANPDTLYEVLKSIALGEHDLEDVGRRSRRYIESHYSIEAVALRLAEMYRETGNLSETWRLNLDEKTALLERVQEQRLSRPLNAQTHS